MDGNGLGNTVSLHTQSVYKGEKQPMKTSDVPNDTSFPFFYMKGNFEMQKVHRGKFLVIPDWRELVTRQESEQMAQEGPIPVAGKS